MVFRHTPVLLEECVQALNIRPDGVYLDGTAGGGGHSLAIARRLSGQGRLISLDKDMEAVKAASERLSEFPHAQVMQRDFSEIPEVLDELGIPAADGVLLDLGVSSHQIDAPGRGFSYHIDGPLDMRMSGAGLSAGDLLNSAPAGELAGIFRRYGEEKFALPIARGVVRAREKQTLETTAQLVEIIRACIPAAARREGGHPAKRVFQALRIAVNGELDSLSSCLEHSFGRLSKGGRFAVITFHSLEDRIVKQSFAEYARGCVCPPDFPICVCGRQPLGKLVGKKPTVPGQCELTENPRSKSAKLRVIEKI